ncbi:hypothetical protein HF888_01090 [Bermanella marisrubri]|uniref:DUF5666 domain-containing protein n=1 Tax=Bermanella marisrubri TaxID=207949 RepID=Q1N4A5_9GAMM|nr:DUF5666 domain-containing protein [Bermanella marisrubri]EAT12960.1 hypothetical protein RED65_14727 [Oceanobacter sp. RED65] [Bermanella marisrubri]QIZ82912.1 hypothetical protein HF888_01090 [Bermanella marisrubri]
MKKLIALPIVLSTSTALLSACGGSSTDVVTKDRAVQGTIDGFGSVIVDGVHYQSTSTEFEIDDTAGAESQLRVGQVVTVVGKDDGTEGVATRIIYDADIKGQVTAVNNQTGELEVLGQAVITNEMTVFSDLDLATIQVGQMVELSGYRDGTGQLIATFIEAETDTESEIKGTVANLDSANKTFSIEGLSIDYSSVASLELDEAELRNGMLVEVEGSVEAGVLVANEIEQEDIRQESEAGVEVDISGYISALDLEANTMVVANTTVSFNGDTEFDDADMSQLDLNLFVSVEGEFNSEGQLVAEEIEFADSVSVELEGPVTGVSGNTVTVMGIDIQVDTRTRIKDDRDDVQYFSAADISVDDYVEVRLTQNADGSYRALRLERDETETDDQGNATVEISGTIDISQIASGIISIAGLDIDITALASTASLTADANVEIGGTFNGSIVSATEVELDD